MQFKICGANWRLVSDTFHSSSSLHTGGQEQYDEYLALDLFLDLPTSQF